MVVIGHRNGLGGGDFVNRILRQRDSDRITDAVFKQSADANRRLNPAFFPVPGFSHAEMEGVIHPLFVHAGCE